MDNGVDVICISSSDDEEFVKTPPKLAKRVRNNKRKNSTDDSKTEIKKFKSTPKTTANEFFAIFNKSEAIKDTPSTSSAHRKFAIQDKAPKVSNIKDGKTCQSKKSQEPMKTSSPAKNLSSDTPKATVRKIRPTLIIKEKVDIPNNGKEVFSKLLEVCRKNCNDSDINKCIEQLKKPFNKLSDEQTNDQELKLFISNKIKSMSKASNNESMFKLMLQVKEELNLRVKQSKIERGSNQDDSDERNDISSDLRVQIQLIKNTMQKCQDKIKQLEEEEVDFDDEDNSSYLKEDRYKKKYIELAKALAKIEKNTELEKNLNNKRKISKENIKGEMSGISIVDDEVLKFYNKRITKINRFKHIENVTANPDFFETPDFLDIRQVVIKCNTTYNLKLSNSQIDSMACKSFKTVSQYLQKRRTKESKIFFESIAQDFGGEEDPAKENEELECVLKKNKEEGDKKLSEIFKKYEDKQNGLSKEELEQMQQATCDSSSESEEESQNYKHMKMIDSEDDKCKKQEKNEKVKTDKQSIDSDSEKEFVKSEKSKYKKKENMKEINEITLNNSDSEQEPARIEKNKHIKQEKKKEEKTKKRKLVDSDNEEESVRTEKQKKEQTIEVQLSDSDIEEAPVRIRDDYRKNQNKTNENKSIDSDNEEEPVKIQGDNCKKQEQQKKEKIDEKKSNDSDSEKEPIEIEDDHHREQEKTSENESIDLDSEEEPVKIQDDNCKKQKQQNKEKIDGKKSNDSDSEKEAIEIDDDHHREQDKTSENESIDLDSEEKPVKIQDDNCKKEEQQNEEKVDGKKSNDSDSEKEPFTTEDDNCKTLEQQKKEKTGEKIIIDLDSEEESVIHEEEDNKKQDETNKDKVIVFDRVEKPVDTKIKPSEGEECNHHKKSTFVNVEFNKNQKLIFDTNSKDEEEISSKQHELTNKVEEEISINKLPSIDDTNDANTKTNDGNKLEKIELKNKQHLQHYQSCNITSPSSNSKDNTSEKIMDVVEKTAIENDETATLIENLVESEIVEDSSYKKRLENDNMDKENLEDNCMRNSMGKTNSDNKNSDENTKKHIEGVKCSEKNSEEPDINNISTKHSSTETSLNEEVSPIQSPEEQTPSKPLLKVKPFGRAPTTWSDSPTLPTPILPNYTDDSIIELDDSVVILDDSSVNSTPPRPKFSPPKVTLQPQRTTRHYPAAFNTTRRPPRSRWNSPPRPPHYNRQRINYYNSNYDGQYSSRYNDKNANRSYRHNPFRK